MGRNGPAARPMAGALRLQLGIPIKIVEPALMQVIGRECPPVAVQVLHRGLERHLRGIQYILASGGVRLPLRRLQSEQAVTRLIQVVCPPREPGFGWTGEVHTVMAY